MLPWATSNPTDAVNAAQEHDNRLARKTTWDGLAPHERREQEGVHAIIPDPGHEVQAYGGVADFWYLDDGDILCDAALVPDFISCFDRANVKVGADRNRLKTGHLLCITGLSCRARSGMAP